MHWRCLQAKDQLIDNMFMGNNSLHNTAKTALLITFQRLLILCWQSIPEWEVSQAEMDSCCFSPIQLSPFWAVFKVFTRSENSEIEFVSMQQWFEINFTNQAFQCTVMAVNPEYDIQPPQQRWNSSRSSWYMQQSMLCMYSRNWSHFFSKLSVREPHVNFSTQRMHQNTEYLWSWSSRLSWQFFRTSKTITSCEFLQQLKIHPHLPKRVYSMKLIDPSADMQLICNPSLELRCHSDQPC